MKLILPIVLISCASLPSFGQVQTDTLKLSDMEIPNSPAFMLLDQAPTAVERPNSSKAFILSALNSFQNNSGIPKNYAVDFTPFWFLRHRKMTALKYAGYNVGTDRQNVFNNVPRASFSFAFVTATDTTTKKDVNNVSLGVRVNLVSWRSKDDIKSIKDANSKLVDFMKKRDDRLQAYINDPTLRVTNPVLYKIRLEEFYEKEANDTKDQEVGLRSLLDKKPFLAIDGAAGYNSFYLNNDFSSGHFGRLGAWGTINYSKASRNNSNNYLNIYAIGRFISDGTQKKDDLYVRKNYLDVGGKVEFEFENISLAYEYIYRKNDDADSFRSNGTIKYKISDTLFLTGAFGRNFGKANNLISMLGINWGLSSGTEKAVVQPN